ncbi:Importin subunit beta-1 [Morella rubra]|uniref:Importin subunit beta-1 n=1 Tax=Morella rubra TaxID=262757 RepID=A0A6A1WGY6_9ROSI|nr:Importin subunit beta-1 [Morella rubra]
MAMEITEFLLSAQSPDTNVRTEAEANLTRFQEQNLPSFLLSLSVELANNEKPTESRRLAGIVLKNSLDAKDAVRKEHLAQQWMAIDFSIKSQIKDLLLRTLGSAAPEARHTSAQVIAKIASIEIPKKQWPELIGSLLNNMTQQDRPAGLKQATLETLGYVCEEISHEDLVQDEVNAVLTAVVQGMNLTEHSPEVRLAATRALYNALDFAQTNFENEMERNYIMKMEEDQDQDDSIWNLSMAGGTCLGLVARTVEDAIVPLVMPFVEGNILKPDWHCREAATYAFGSILEGPTVGKLSPLVHAGLDFLLKAMKDENNQVRDTTAWTLSRIFELLHNPASGMSVISSENLQQVVGVLLESVNDMPNVAEKVCGAIYYLCQGYFDAGLSSLLTPFLTNIITHLIRTADRTDGGDSKLRSSAYETLNEVVRCSYIAETHPVIEQLLPVIMNKLGQTLELQIVSTDDRARQGDLQASLCGVLQVIIQKLGSTDETIPIIHRAADQIMAMFLRVFACRSSTVHEEAMLAIGSLAYACGPKFEKYMGEFYPYLEMELQNFEEYQVCSITVGVVGDICRALDGKVLQFCDGIMKHLLNDLGSNELHRSVKPHIFSCFGDIALAIGEHFERYVLYAVQAMQQAAEVCAHINADDEELMEYGNQLRRSIFEAYSGILQGFKDSKPEVMLPYAAHLVQFIEFVFLDRQRDEFVTKAAVAVMGDLADALGSNTKLLFSDRAFYVEFLGECLQSEDESIKETATWTQGMIGRVMVS